MDSFLKDVLSAIILASWVFPVLYLTLALVAGKLAALYRQLRGASELRPAARAVHIPAATVACPQSSSIVVTAAPAVRRGPAAAVGVAVPMARLVRPRLAARWKSSHRVSASPC